MFCPWITPLLADNQINAVNLLKCSFCIMKQAVLYLASIIFHPTSLMGILFFNVRWKHQSIFIYFLRFISFNYVIFFFWKTMFRMNEGRVKRWSIHSIVVLIYSSFRLLILKSNVFYCLKLLYLTLLFFSYNDDV